MNGPQAAQGRRILVHEIIVKYSYEDDPGTVQEFGMKHEDGGVDVDGVIWSRSLMDRLAYSEGPGKGCRPAPQQQGKGWKRIGKKNGDGEPEVRSLGAMAAGPGGPECIFIHNENCTWEIFCDPQL